MRPLADSPVNGNFPLLPGLGESRLRLIDGEAVPTLQASHLPLAPVIDQLAAGQKSIAVIGLGYVGLPLALEFARHYDVVGFDISASRVAMMQRGEDPSAELGPESFAERRITFTTNPDDLRNCGFYVVAVPTDITEGKVPNLTPLQKSSETVAATLQPGDIVVYESTVYPGCTEEVCIPILEAGSGLERVKDFKFGYSPERI